MQQRPSHETRGHLRAVATPSQPAPSPAARASLTDALRESTGGYLQDASVDLTLVDVLLRMDEAEAAVRTIDDHREALHAMARDLQVAVADAAVTREAELVCDAWANAHPAVAPTGRLRRRVMAATGAAAVAIALLLPSARMTPRTTLTSLEGRPALGDVAGAKERFEAARSWARALRADVAATRPARSSDDVEVAAIDPVRGRLVRDKVRYILAADTSGGSAAPSSDDAGGIPTGDRPSADEPAGGDDDLADVIPITPNVQLPQSGPQAGVDVPDVVPTPTATPTPIETPTAPPVPIDDDESPTS